MKKILTVLTLSYSILVAQDTFVRGVYMFGDPTGDFQRLRDSLHLNWVQANIEKWDYQLGRYVLLDGVLQNNGNLNIMGVLEKTVYPHSAGQRMVFEAEQPQDPLTSYFANTPSGNRDGIFLVSSGSAGYMVKDAVPDNEYRYKETHYVAKFVIKRDTGFSGDPLVARLEIVGKRTNMTDTIFAQKDLRALTDFNTNDLDTTSIPFDVTYSPTPQSTPRLEGLLLAQQQQEALLTYDGIDLRVWWYGNVTTWLDKVIVEDSLGLGLFSGAFDNDITTSLQSVTGYSLLKRTYLFDEPQISSFLSFNYVQEESRQAWGNPADGTGSGITATNKPESFERFLIDAQPHELLVNPFPLSADVPIPISAMSAAGADSVGIAQYISDANYTGILQTRIQSECVNYVLKPAAILANQSGKPLWVIPQVHGVYFERSGKFRFPIIGNDLDNDAHLRPPTGNEVKMMCNLAVAYGAKGLIPFTHGTDHVRWDEEGWTSMPGLVSSVADQNGIHRNHWTNYGEFYDSLLGGNKTIWVGYKEKWDALASVNAKIVQLEATLMQLSWQGAKSWKSGDAAGSGCSILSSVSAKTTGGVLDDDPYVETGYFTLASLDYLVVVNRRTLDVDARDVTFALNKGAGMYEVTDRSSGNIWIVNGSHGQMTLRLNPGDFALLEVKSYTPWTSKTFAGTEVVRVTSNATMTIPANAAITNIRQILVESGGVLSITSGAELKFTSATNVYDESSPKGSMAIYGRINAYGAAFTSNTTDPNYYWAGIYLVNSNPQDDYSSIQCCVISKCKFGLSINNSQLSGFGSEIAWNTFAHCLNPIGLTYGAVVQDIAENTLEDNLEDGIVVWQSTVGRAYGNIIRKNNASYSGRDGFWVYGGNSQVLITDNQLSNGSQDGIRCEYYAAPNLGGPNGQTNVPGNNTITGYGRHGVHAQSTTQPFLGDYDYANDCAKYGGANYIYSNAGKQLNAVPYGIRAEWNWWGTDPDDQNDPWSFEYSTYTSLFGGWPIVRPAMKFDGGEERITLAKDVLSQNARTLEASDETIPTEKILLVLADQLAINNQHSNAIAVYDSLILNYPNSAEAEAALLRIHYELQKFMTLIFSSISFRGRVNWCPSLLTSTPAQHEW